MTDKILAWLLEENNPSVRYLTLTTLLDRAPDDPEVLAARESIMTQGVVAKLLEKQNGDGSWVDPGRFYTDKYHGAVWNLITLAEFTADPSNEQVKKACEFILHSSYNPENGGFSTAESARTKSGLVSLIVPCLTGNMVFALIKLGYLEDERLRKGIEWILTYQRSDDGEERPPLGEMYDRYRSCWGSHSCHMGVAKSLKALAAIPVPKRNEQVDAKIRELVDYFLKHRVYKKSHHPEEIAKPGWLKFGFPLMYQSDALEILDILASLKIHSPQLDDAIGLVQSKRSPEGYWNLENSYSDRMLVSIEQKGKPSKWVTLRALRALKEYR
jgi:hypothetical protein